MNAIRTITKVPKWVRVVAAVLVAALAGWIVYGAVNNIGKTHITAYFPSTTGLYAGDDVRVLGVKVGRIDSIEPGRDKTKVTMTVDRGVDIPAAAKAVTVSPNLVSARFVQLAPVYTGGPKMHDDGVIPIEHTAVPVEWDDIKAELTKLSKALGPIGEDQQGSFGRFVNTASDNLANGNAQALRDTLHELSSTLNTLSDGRTDLFGTVRNLQQFVDVLSKSNDQIVQFGGRLASVSSVLSGVSDDLGAGLDNLDSAVADVKRFLDERGGRLTESVQNLAQVTQILADKRPQLEQVLHSGPVALSNFYQIYKPAQGTLTGSVALPNFRNPFAFLCGAVEALEDNGSQRTADLCKQQVAPVINSLMMNYPPLLVNPASGQQAFPNQLTFSTPDLADRVQYPAPGQAPSEVPSGLAGLAIPGGGR
ncbi:MULTISPECIES: MCE family protein [Nocardia]|uniref:MCE family protein n=1 Tax=Nocardia TaxID=1817 RepID=UPI0007EAC279|nr:MULTISPECIES: MCE family protein [Nocardia]MBF6272085.1 MCE family protein [Nocardia nova]OBA45496.1 mammalian cell entry protein [Nocardia sp. 852002-51101_SCH5132738]OBB50722.1 mammalian cell entry protein [Nocardia sp. 852002-51244_SCH5132740]OBF63984.1 mammalian cell entry protein [Mycobacterium sp. 852002-51759_SCH5129042]